MVAFGVSCHFDPTFWPFSDEKHCPLGPYFGVWESNCFGNLIIFIYIVLFYVMFKDHMQYT